jgi:hypothetical protein
MRLLVTGSSHCGMIYKTKKGLQESNGFRKIDWLVTSGNLYLPTNPDTQEISPPVDWISLALKKKLKYIHPDYRVIAKNYDVIYYNSIGVRPHGVYSDHPIIELIKQPLSKSLLKELVINDGTLKAHMSNIRGIRKSGFKGQIILSKWIRPHILIDGLDIKDWKQFCDIESTTIDIFAAESHSNVLSYPDNTNFITPAGLISNAPGNHATHGNEIYGSLINKAFMATLKV